MLKKGSMLLVRINSRGKKKLENEVKKAEK